MAHHDGQNGGQIAPVLPLQGGCACGNIRYSLNTTPLVVHCCHCTSCQRETGTAFALNALVVGDEVTLLPSATSAPRLQPLASFPSSAVDDWTPRARSSPDAAHGTTPAKHASDADGPAASNANVVAGEQTNDEEIASPVLLPVPGESGEPQLIARCPTCLTPVWSNYGGSGPLLKFLRVGTLDSPALLGGPDVHIFVRSKQPFVEIPDDGKPRFDAFYPQKEGVWRPEGLARREKLVARIVAYYKETGSAE